MRQDVDSFSAWQDKPKKEEDISDEDAEASETKSPSKTVSKCRACAHIELSHLLTAVVELI